jgi:hypothetical protein
MDWPSWIEAIGAAITAIFTVVLAIATIKLWSSTVNAALAAKNSADAANAAVALAKDTAEKQLRAYVGIDKPRVLGMTVGNKPIVLVTVKNCGQTPAYNVRGWHKYIFGPVPLDLEFPEGRSGGVTTLHAGQTVEFRSEMPVLTEELLTAFGTSGDQGIALWVYGKISYDDAFGAPHISNFRHLTGVGRYRTEIVDGDNVAPLRADPKGNDCD